MSTMTAQFTISEAEPPARRRVGAEPEPEPEPEQLVRLEEEDLGAAIRETFGSTAVRSTKVRTPRRSQNPQHYAALNTAAWLTSLPDGGIGAKGEVALAYRNIDDTSVVRVMHYLLAQRRFVKKLSLHCNDIATLPSWIGQLSALEELHLSHNRLRELPSSVGQLTALRKLTCHHNQLEALPECLALLPQLEQLEVEANPLRSPPMDVCRDGVDALKSYFARRLAARQRLAFASAAHARLGADSPAGAAHLDAETLALLSASRLGGLLGGPRVATRLQVELGQRRLDAEEVQSSRTMLRAVESVGFMTKKGKRVKNWKQRWFVLSFGQLCYFERRSTAGLEHVLQHRSHSATVSGRAQRGVIDLLEVFHVQGVEEDPPTIELATPTRSDDSLSGSLA